MAFGALHRHALGIEQVAGRRRHADVDLIADLDPAVALDLDHHHGLALGTGAEIGTAAPPLDHADPGLDPAVGRPADAAPLPDAQDQPLLLTPGSSIHRSHAAAPPRQDARATGRPATRPAQ